MSEGDDLPGLQSTSARKHHNLLHKALKQAVKWELISRNPTDFVEPPTIKEYEASVLPDEKSILDLLELVKGMLIYLPVLIAITCGLRRGEICALRWQDMVWETGRLHVRHSLYREAGVGLKLK
jgi:integrase